ncbi:MAG: MoxR family ATPase [Acidimicrobiia bacterium]|nr:MoxR family ATPase [Acidimicrobiia bacterium]
MTVATQNIQLEQALFEIRNAVVGKHRAIDRMVAATIVGGPISLVGPNGVGKTHLIDSIARVFGLVVTESVGVEVVGAELRSGAHSRRNLYVVDADAPGDSKDVQLTSTLSRIQVANLVVTGTHTNPDDLTSGLRDILLGFVEIPYPSASEEVAMALDSAQPRHVDRILRVGDLESMRSRAVRLPVADSVLAYAVRLVQATRDPSSHGVANLAPLVAAGASPRASIALVRMARGLALVAGHDEVTVQDVYDAAYEVLVHRIRLSQSARERGVGPPDIVVELLSRVPAVEAGYAR